MTGITELKEAVLFAAQVCDSSHLIMADGKVGVTDIPELWKLLQAANPALTGIDKVPEELADLDEAELNEMIAAIDEKFKVGSEKSKLILTHTMKSLFHGYQTFLAIRG